MKQTFNSKARRIIPSVVLTAALALPCAAHADNIIPGNWASITATGYFGTLRAGSSWAPEPSFEIFSRMNSVVDNAFLPASTQWNTGTLWWDQDASVNSNLVTFDIQFYSTQTINRLVVQADDNDMYQVDYWDGAVWLSAWSIDAVGGYGMQTRDSGLFAPINTTRLRFYATGGDDYYSVSEIQAFNDVPEPESLALLGLGLAGLGALRRRNI